MANAELCARLVLKRPGFSLDVDLNLPGQGVTALFGQSGSGKTTLLRCVAGLERAQTARVTFNGMLWQDQKTFVPVHKRPLGYVFQEASLFEHLSARENLMFALRRAGKSGERAFSLNDAVELLGIGRILQRRPGELSGGERQRVAIARALLISPRLLLLDEPLASLDHARKQEILPYLEKLKDEIRLPVLYVTHSPDEVARLADYLVALDNGRVVASGTLADTLNSLDFPIHLGEDAGAVVDAVVTERDAAWHLAKATIPGGSLWFRDYGHRLGQRIRVRVLARDISLSLMHGEETSIINALPASVLEIVADDHPGLALVKLSAGQAGAGSSILIARVTRRSVAHLNLASGTRVWAQVKSVAIVE